MSLSYCLLALLALFVAANAEVITLTDEDFAEKTATGNWFVKFYGMLVPNWRFF